jgi:hypothetical protein
MLFSEYKCIYRINVLIKKINVFSCRSIDPVGGTSETVQRQLVNAIG